MDDPLQLDVIMNGNVVFVPQQRKRDRDSDNCNADSNGAAADTVPMENDATTAATHNTTQTADDDCIQMNDASTKVVVDTTAVVVANKRSCLHHTATASASAAATTTACDSIVGDTERRKNGISTIGSVPGGNDDDNKVDIAIVKHMSDDNTSNSYFPTTTTTTTTTTGSHHCPVVVASSTDSIPPPWLVRQQQFTTTSTAAVNNNNNNSNSVEQRNKQHSAEPVVVVTQQQPQQHATLANGSSSAMTSTLKTQQRLPKQQQSPMLLDDTSNDSLIMIVAFRYIQLFVVPILVFYVSYYLCFRMTTTTLRGNLSWQQPLSFNTVVSSSLFMQKQQQQHTSNTFRWLTTTGTKQSSVASLTTTTKATSSSTTASCSTLESEVLTLRHIIHDTTIGFHLAMAPAFFGFYAYFGILSAWYDSAITDHAYIKTNEGDNFNVTETVSPTTTTSPNTTKPNTLLLPIRSIVGASAGAMAAILLAAGITPMDAMNFCSNITVDQYADFPGFLSLFRGNMFEQIIHDFLQTHPQNKEQQQDGTSSSILLMEDGRIPVAVTAFDILTMTTQILMEGSMARAARASATFPGLFQPVRWTTSTEKDKYLFIDGGVMDTAGTMGLLKTMNAPSTIRSNSNSHTKHRVINLSLGSFRSQPGPHDLPNNPEVISISMIGLPQPGPWAMSNGPIAYEIARAAMIDALDMPLQRVDSVQTLNQAETSSPHYQLVINVKQNS